MPAEAVACRGLKKYYSDVRAVDGLDLFVGNGECFGLLGPNGAGKTTTIEILEGLTVPDSGEVEVLGLTWQQNELKLRERIGISLQETQLSEKLTVYETVRLFRSFYPSGPDPDDLIREREDARHDDRGTRSRLQRLDVRHRARSFDRAREFPLSPP